MEVLWGQPPKTPAPSPSLPFDHALCRWSPAEGAQVFYTRYAMMAACLGFESPTITPTDPTHPTLPSVMPPHNLLVTRQWMLMVPRTAEHVDGMSINSLGYAGALFVRHAGQLAQVRARGPMGMLVAVGR